MGRARRFRFKRLFAPTLPFPNNLPKSQMNALIQLRGSPSPNHNNNTGKRAAAIVVVGSPRISLPLLLGLFATPELFGAAAAVIG